MNEGDKRDLKILSYLYTGMVCLLVGIFVGVLIGGGRAGDEEQAQDINQSISAECIVIDGISGDSIKVELQRERKYDIKISGAEDSSIELTFDKDEEDK